MLKHGIPFGRSMVMNDGVFRCLNCGNDNGISLVQGARNLVECPKCKYSIGGPTIHAAKHTWNELACETYFVVEYRQSSKSSIHSTMLMFRHYLENTQTSISKSSPEMLLKNGMKKVMTGRLGIRFLRNGIASTTQY